MTPATSPFATRGLRLLAAAAVAALGMLASVPAALAVAPVNDPLQSPFNVDLAGGAVTTNNTEATYQDFNTYAPGEPRTPGGPGTCDGRTMVATTWYRIIGNGGVISVNTAGSSFDTVVAAYYPPAPSLADGLPCNDDASAGTFTSAISFQSEAGRAYLVQVGGCNMCGGASVPTGNMVMNVSATAPPPPPPAPPPPPPPPPPDADGDGVPEDGRDKCPGLKPTRDDNQDGCQDPPKAILSLLPFQALPFGNRRAIRGVTISGARLTLVPKGARVTVSCSRCRKPGGLRRLAFTAKRAGTQPVGGLSGVRLLRGGQLTVIITSPQRLGRKIVVTLGRRGPNGNKNTCLAVGSRTQRVPCPSAG